MKVCVTDCSKPLLKFETSIASWRGYSDSSSLSAPNGSQSSSLDDDDSLSFEGSIGPYYKKKGTVRKSLKVPKVR